jgi:hypothetical protein
MNTKFWMVLSAMAAVAACTVDPSGDECGDDDDSGSSNNNHFSSGAGNSGSGSNGNNGSGAGGNGEGNSGSGAGDSGSGAGTPMGASCNEVCDRIAGCGLLVDGVTYDDCVNICATDVDQPTRDWALDATCDELAEAIQSGFGGQ